MTGMDASDQEMQEKSRLTRFEEAVRRASERYERRRADIDMVWRKAQNDPVYAYHAAHRLAAKARYDRRQACRHLHDRFGVEAPSDENDPVFEYPVVRPERSPRDARGRLLRAKAVMEHAEAENVWRAVKKCESFAPADQGRMAVKFACEAMRQTPALWAYFVMNENNGLVREHALAQLVGWLDNETKVYREDRSHEEKLHGLAAVAERAWEDLSALIEKAGLSRRQAQVIERQRRGEEDAEIAAALGISENNVYRHRSAAMEKLRAVANQ